MTAPIRVGQTRLHLNAETEPDGSIVWEVVDGDANVVRGPGTFRGDDAGAEVADLSGLVGQTVRVRFTVERARLYAFLL